MNKLLSLVACLLFVGSAVAENNYIRVVGTAPTLEQAKELAFREAIQIRVGTIVLSERESSFENTLKDNVSVYSAGYVDDYKIISVVPKNSNVVVTLDVLVADSKLMNQKLSQGKDKKSFDGEKVVTTLNSFLQQKQKGDQLLQTVMGSYPKNAFVINQQPYVLTLDSYRNTILNIPYTMQWNKDFIVAMREAMSLLEDNTYKSGAMAPANVVINSQSDRDWFKFNDMPTLFNIKNEMSGSKELRIRLEMFDGNGSSLYKRCYAPNAISNRKPVFYNIYDTRGIFIFGNGVESGIIQLQIPPTYNPLMQQTSKIELSVVNIGSCN